LAGAAVDILPAVQSRNSNDLMFSDDGSVIVGTGTNELGREAVMWTQSAGMVGLGDFAEADFGSVARGVNGDGSSLLAGARLT
jgi:hypothetical protein